jgi:ribosome biogenesis GTPase
MRELHLWDGGDGLVGVFEDIELLSKQCRFRDCRHDTEPGCAVHAAVAGGHLNSARLGNYQKMKREIAFLARRRDPVALSEEKKVWKQRNKNLRARFELRNGVIGNEEEQQG